MLWCFWGLVLTSCYRTVQLLLPHIWRCNIRLESAWYLIGLPWNQIWDHSKFFEIMLSFFLIILIYLSTDSVTYIYNDNYLISPIFFLSAVDLKFISIHWFPECLCLDISALATSGLSWVMVPPSTSSSTTY